jgi:hypothetical protein
MEPVTCGLFGFISHFYEERIINENYCTVNRILRQLVPWVPAIKVGPTSMVKLLWPSYHEGSSSDGRRMQFLPPFYHRVLRKAFGTGFPTPP